MVLSTDLERDLETPPAVAAAAAAAAAPAREIPGGSCAIPFLCPRKAWPAELRQAPVRSSPPSRPLPAEEPVVLVLVVDRGRPQEQELEGGIGLLELLLHFGDFGPLAAQGDDPVAHVDLPLLLGSLVE
eukprot:CAMPEP_0168451238 /NCGR_PEP_ID=MMETSP0228-20121227/48534_1 /TAXON_ID=133427 /ORGANISM="Protoceratium reticulatum, Strain CCCM 535 (=CCMP 1889)" /LENGTH=128 /DNA_ID=CAMNT_0008465851 /DNA_START=330 /DNA_END=714 /DNA_ORIENTATION=+